MFFLRNIACWYSVNEVYPGVKYILEIQTEQASGGGAVTDWVPLISLLPIWLLFLMLEDL